MLDESKLQKGELRGIADILMCMQEYKNDGSGVDDVKILAKKLKRGEVKEAIQTARDVADRLTVYPEIRRFVHDVIYPIGYLDPDTGLLVNDKE